MILFLNFRCFSIMVFDFTQWWMDGRPGNEYFWNFPHKISDLLTPLTPLGVRPQWLLIVSLKMKFETDWSNSSQCAFRVTGSLHLILWVLVSVQNSTRTKFNKCKSQNVQQVHFILNTWGKTCMFRTWLIHQGIPLVSKILINFQS